MGLNMDNIHIPSIASGPTTGHASSKSPEQDKLSLMELYSVKQRVENEISALSRVLDSYGVNMNTSLNTYDGYPRDDIDIPQIRHTRVQIIRLRNDWKSLMTRIEEGLHAVHASHESKKASNALSASSSSQEVRMSGENLVQDPDTIEPAFAEISSVTSGGPAADAGLQVGDRIRAFGNVDWMNHEKLSKVSETIQRNEGQAIILKVARQVPDKSQPEELQYQLIPRRNWGGRGLLGCQIIPV